MSSTKPPSLSAYGSWRSPITPDLISSSVLSLDASQGAGDKIYWLEGRPVEGGRQVVVQWTEKEGAKDVLAAPYNARSRVHEYGGGALATSSKAFYFVNFKDQRWYSGDDKGLIKALTPQDATKRYADATIDLAHASLYCVQEDHSQKNEEAKNRLVRVSLSEEMIPQIVAEGADFYASPRLSPDGSKLAWLSWNHPHMPWESTELWVAEREDGNQWKPPVKVAGGASESINQPEWSAAGELYFVSDRSGWANLYVWNKSKTVLPLGSMPAEFSRPQWVFGTSAYAILEDQRLLCAVNKKGIWELCVLDPASQKLIKVETPYTEFRSVRAAKGGAVFIAGSPKELWKVVYWESSSGKCRVLKKSSEIAVDPGFISVPQTIEYPTGGNTTSHGFFYPPRNENFKAPEGEKPPLLVVIHGGPTAACASVLNFGIQFWTSRGFGVLDVNYRGSTGFGRAYRRLLEGNWGIADVEDCIYGAEYLAKQGKVDRERLAIRGGSAGGYTTLCALTFHDTFRAGASYYGISDLEALVNDTHKFESRYNVSLVGDYPAEKQKYIKRSPIHFTEKLSCPLILFQGLEDKVVPPNQAERMFEAVKAKGIPVAYVPFEGEDHGFRKTENIKRALEAELYFYSRVFGFTLADPVTPVRIENLGG